MKNRDLTKVLSIFMAAALVTSLGACNTISTISDSSSSGEESTIQSVTASETTTEEDILITSEMNNDVDRLVAANGKPVGIVFADLNGLKTVNDREGHDAGDQLLRDAVSALREVFNDDEIYRAGGDEFTVILLGATEEELARKAEQLRRAEKKYNRLSFAVGYHAEESTACIREALRIADERMYEDKRIYYEKNPSARRNSRREAAE